MTIPPYLASICRKTAAGTDWLGRLPTLAAELQARWRLDLEEPFASGEASCAWVAPATLRDGTPVVLKLGMPHMEGRDEIPGLRFWNGDPTAALIASDETAGAMLLERCRPGTALRELAEPEQDGVIARLLRRLWRRPEQPHGFRPLAAMIRLWSGETRSAREFWPDPPLVEEGLSLLEQLSRPAPGDVLLATDLHAGNVLRAQREPWLVIDPKPFTGDPAYDATQHLLNCAARLLEAPGATIGRFASLLEVDAERVRLWTFARAAAEPREDWREAAYSAIAAALSRIRC